MKNPAPQAATLTTHSLDTNDRTLWDRLPGESPRAWNAFVTFRDLAERRTLKAVAEVLNCSVQNIHRWSDRWRWSERTLAYDIHRDEVERRELARGRLEMRRRHMRLGMQMQAIAAHALRELQAKVEQKLPLNLSPDEARALMQAGARLEADAIGPEREGRYAHIVVNLGDHEYEGEGEDSTPEIEGEKKKLPN